ncbi:MAG: glycosyltransferase [Chloroflexota bacterium]
MVDGDVDPAALDVLFVADWFPAYDDPAAGRFVADQAEAVAATGIARPRVLSFSPALLTGGATARRQQESAVTAAAIAAASNVRTGFLPTAGVRNGVTVARLTTAEGRTSTTGSLHAHRHRADILAAFADARSSAAARRPGVVHAHVVYPAGAAAVALADRLGWPLIVTEHSSFVGGVVADPAVRERYAATLARAHRVLAVGSMLADELRRAFPVAASRIDVLPNAVPIDDFPAVGPEKRTPDQLLFVGHRKPTKGIETLLRATALARAGRPTITLRLIGRAPDPAVEAQWRGLAAEVGLGDAVTFEDAADRNAIATAMRTAALFVHPSPRETFGVVAVEALASGLPVVATDSGGVTEIMGEDPRSMGALVPAGDPAALSHAILATLDRVGEFDPADLRRNVERRYGSAFIAERLAVVYRDAVAANPSARGLVLEVPARVAADTATTLVVGLDRRRAAWRLAALPDGLRSSIVVVTAVEPRGIELPVIGRVVEVDVDVRWAADPDAPPRTRRPGLAGRLARLAHDPAGTARRVLRRDPGTAPALAPASEAVVALAHELGRDRPVEIVALDGHDHLAADEAVRAAARPAGGGLRRLVDEWQAATSAGESQG